MGFGSDVIEEKVSPCGDAFFCVSRAVVIVHEIYIGDFANISAQLEIYRRLFEYIDFPAKNDNYRKAYFQFHRRIT
ncbi:hypothetical protein BCER1_52300 [Bacillus cereus]|nr:hypothetical protein BCER1_52300 [Bacillus cereus]